MVLAYYEEIKNFMKFHAKNDPKSEHKIDVWAIRGPTFEVLGGFLRSLIFYLFSIGKKIAHLRSDGRRREEKGIIEGAVGG